MLITERQLRSIIRKLLIERKTPKDRTDGTKVLGEPDASEEDQRDNPTIDQGDDSDECSFGGQGESAQRRSTDEQENCDAVDEIDEQENCDAVDELEEYASIGGGGMGGGPMVPVGVGPGGSRSRKRRN